MFRLTFNPAATALFGGDTTDVRGIRIRMTNDMVFLKPSTQAIGNDVAPIGYRARGGTEVFIEGSSETELLKILESFKTQFFALSINEHGWIVLTPWRGDEAPRNRPFMRVWFPKHQTNAPRSVLTEYEELRKIVNDYGKVGRPPREIAEAKAKLREYDEIVAMIVQSRESHRAF